MLKFLRAIYLFPLSLLLGVPSVSNTPNSETGATVRKVVQGGDEGVLIGEATTNKVGFYGVTPITQRTSASQAAVVTTVAVSTTSNIWGFSTSTQANSIVSLVNELRAAMVAIGVIKGS